MSKELHLQPVVSWVCSRKVSQGIEIGRLAASCLILGFGFEIPRENGSLRDASPAGTLTTTCPAAKGERSGQAVCQVRKPRAHTHTHANMPVCLQARTHTRKHARMSASRHAHLHTYTQDIKRYFSIVGTFLPASHQKYVNIDKLFGSITQQLSRKSTFAEKPVEADDYGNLESGATVSS